MKWIFPNNEENVPINMEHVLYFEKPEGMPRIWLIEFVMPNGKKFAWSYSTPEERDGEYGEIYNRLRSASWKQV